MRSTEMGNVFAKASEAALKETMATFQRATNEFGKSVEAVGENIEKQSEANGYVPAIGQPNPYPSYPYPSPYDPYRY